MSADRLPLSCDTALAARIERAEADLIARASEAARRRRGDTAGFVIPIAGGVASFADHGSPFNKVAGLGFGGVPSATALNNVERTFAARGAHVQIELAHLADPAIGALLTERGYRLTSFENVLGHAFEGQRERVTPPGVEVRPSGDDELEAWLDAVADGVAHPDTQGLPQHQEFPREVRRKGRARPRLGGRHALCRAARWGHGRRRQPADGRRRRAAHRRRASPAPTATR